MIYEFNGFRPVVDSNSFVHEQATVTGDVIIGKQVYIAPGAAIRGDWGQSLLKMGAMFRRTALFTCFPVLQ